jgi:hypothetical protein
VHIQTDRKIIQTSTSKKKMVKELVADVLKKIAYHNKIERKKENESTNK